MMRHFLLLWAWVSAWALLEGDLIRKALRFADISLVKAALWMDDMDVRQLDRELKGIGHLKADALEKLPLKFHQWKNYLGVLQYGLPAEVEEGLPVALAAHGQKRMAKAQLSETEKEGVA